jgi:predicted ATP-dependent endonuclease of OLD family
LQREDELPKLIVVDEPELGLHPYALNVVADLFSKAALHTPERREFDELRKGQKVKQVSL